MVGIFWWFSIWHHILFTNVCQIIQHCSCDVIMDWIIGHAERINIPTTYLYSLLICTFLFNDKQIHRHISSSFFRTRMEGWRELVKAKHTTLNNPGAFCTRCQNKGWEGGHFSKENILILLKRNNKITHLFFVCWDNELLLLLFLWFFVCIITNATPPSLGALKDALI